MRIGTWNCQAGLASNWDAVEQLNVDVLTVQECEPATREHVEAHAGWTCRDQRGRWGKGLAVLAHGAYEIKEQEESEPFVVSTLIVGPDGFRFRFVGFWAMTPKSVGYTYTRQARRLIERLPHDQLPTVVAGDFNASKSAAHLRNVQRLKALGLVSAYHAHNGVEHTGVEEEHTSYFMWSEARPYHMDFVFVPKEWSIDSVKIGTFAEYPGRRRSDHVPVVVSVTPE